MSRVIGPSLPAPLRARLSQEDLASVAGVALPFATIDSDGRPHPMLLSYLEVRAYDAATIGLVIHGGSDSARNLAARDVATLSVIEPDVVAYVKLRRIDGPLAVVEDPRLAYFLLAVEEVREDSTAPEEAGARIVSAARYAPAELESPWARLTRRAVAQPRARA